MLNEWSCAGHSRTQVTEPASFEQQLRRPSPKSAHSFRSKQSRVTSPSIESTPRKLLKRARPQEDIDGEEWADVQRKKRRLRHDLVTSRLSRPYATPATHIIGTKAWRVGAWARQRFAGGKLLRKAAILNWITMKRKRSRADSMEASEPPTGSVPSTYGSPFEWISSRELTCQAPTQLVTKSLVEEVLTTSCTILTSVRL